MGYGPRHFYCSVCGFSVGGKGSAGIVAASCPKNSQHPILSLSKEQNQDLPRGRGTKTKALMKLVKAGSVSYVGAKP